MDEIAQVIAAEANACCGHAREVRVIYKEAAAKRGPAFKLDNGKLKTLGWDIHTSLAEGVRYTLLANMCENVQPSDNDIEA